MLIVSHCVASSGRCSLAARFDPEWQSRPKWPSREHSWGAEGWRSHRRKLPAFDVKVFLFASIEMETWFSLAFSKQALIDTSQFQGLYTDWEGSNLVLNYLIRKLKRDFLCYLGWQLDRGQTFGQASRASFEPLLFHPHAAQRRIVSRCSSYSLALHLRLNLTGFYFISLYVHGGRDLKEGSIASMWRLNLTKIHKMMEEG